MSSHYFDNVSTTGLYKFYFDSLQKYNRKGCLLMLYQIDKQSVLHPYRHYRPIPMKLVVSTLKRRDEYCPRIFLQRCCIRRRMKGRNRSVCFWRSFPNHCNRNSFRPDIFHRTYKMHDRRYLASVWGVTPTMC